MTYISNLLLNPISEAKHLITKYILLKFFHAPKISIWCRKEDFKMKNLVEPIKDKKDVEAIEKYLAKHSLRNQLIWIFGINTGLRISDILGLNVESVKGKQYVEVVEKKTKKFKRFPLNKKLQKLIKEYLVEREKKYYSITGEEPLFVGKKHKRLHRSQVYRFINDVCKKSNINYSLIGGSLIGAIRHKGIIPWDDDIDIILMPDEYDKLINELKKANKGRYRLIDVDVDNNYYLPYAKLVDTKTVAIEKGTKKIDNYGVFVDIFKYTYLPDNDFIRKIYLARYKFMLDIIHGFGKLNKEDNILKRIRTYLSKKISTCKYIKRFDRYSRKYNNTTYIISNWPVYGQKKEIQFSKNMKKYSIVNFEKGTAMITENYDEILKTTFGDYMTPPPLENQIAHHNICSYWK